MKACKFPSNINLFTDHPIKVQEKTKEKNKKCKAKLDAIEEKKTKKKHKRNQKLHQLHFLNLCKIIYKLLNLGKFYSIF
jgi:hypothetical protein